MQTCPCAFRQLLPVAILASILISLAAHSLPALASPPPAVERIKQSPDHRYGIGCADDPDNARQAALNTLVQSVRVHVVTHSRSRVEDHGDEVTSQFERTVQSNSSMPIHGLRSLAWRDGDQHCAMAYVRHDSLAAGFERSEAQMHNLIRDAGFARETGRLGDALRNLFWAYLLAGSLLESCTVTVPGTDLTEPTTALLAGIRAISEGLSIQTGRPDMEGSLITLPLYAEFEGRPVEQIDFRYYRGHGQEWLSYRHGRSNMVELDFERTNLVLNLLHVYSGDLNRHPELAAAYQAMGQPELDLYVTVPVRYPWHESLPPEPQVSSALPQGRKLPPEMLPPPHRRPAPSQTPPSEAPARLPQPIRSLLACEDGPSFARTLKIYQRNGRLVVGQSQADVQHLRPRIFLALVDPDRENLQPILLAPVANGFRDLRSQTHHSHLSDFRGWRLIHLGVPESP